MLHALTLAPIGFAGAFLLTYAGGAVALLIALAGLGAAAAGSRAVLRGDSDRKVRLATARGLLSGLIVGGALIVADVVLEVYS